MVEEKKQKIRRLTWLLSDLEGEDYEKFVLIKWEDALLVKGAGLLQPYDGYHSIDMSSAKAADIMQLRASEQRAKGKRVVASDGSFYTIEIRALRKLVGNLSRDDETVSENENLHKEEHKPQEEAGNWQRAVTHKDEDAVLLAVRVEPEIRDQFHALMRAKGTTAQEYLGNMVTEQVRQNPDLVKKGQQMEAQGTKKNYRSKLQILKEEVARLRGLAADKSSRSA